MLQADSSTSNRCRNLHHQIQAVVYSYYSTRNVVCALYSILYMYNRLLVCYNKCWWNWLICIGLSQGADWMGWTSWTPGRQSTVCLHYAPGMLTKFICRSVPHVILPWCIACWLRFTLNSKFKAYYTVFGKKYKPQTILDRNVKSQRILTNFHALDSEYIFEKNAKFRYKIFINSGFISFQIGISTTKYISSRHNNYIVQSLVRKWRFLTGQSSWL